MIKSPAAIKVLSAILFVAGLLGLAASARAQQTARAKALGHKLMCVCGCNEVLISCNHVGCTYSHDMLKELDERVARGDSDDLILQSFVQEYGPNVLSEPPAKGFNWVAWIVPVIAPLAACYILWEVARRWRRTAAVTPAPASKVSAELIARAQREAREGDNE
jgi:cytochrome c-type biogenesis protein CcmH